MSRFEHSLTLEVEGKSPFLFILSHLATKTSLTWSLSTPAGPLNGTYRLSSVRRSRRFGILRTQRPTISAKASALSVECDQRPAKARQTLEALLGPATAVVASGGEWTNPETGEIEPKVHLHWRLKKPTTTTEEHDLLEEARELATKLVGGDGTNISIVHPIRWPGSWHRKGTPRLAKIVASSDNEIDLAEAVERLRDASGAATFAGFGFKTEQQARRRRSGGRSLGSLGHPERRSRVERLEQDRHGHLGRYRRLGSRSRGVCQVVGQGVEERPDCDREPLAALQDLAADEDRVWHPGLPGPQALAGMDYDGKDCTRVCRRAS